MPGYVPAGLHDRSPPATRLLGSFHAELQLQLHLKTLECTLQVSDIRLAHLELLPMLSNLSVHPLGLADEPIGHPSSYSLP